MLVDQLSWITRVAFFGGRGTGEIGGAYVRGGAGGAQLGKIQNPAAGGAVQIGHVDEQGVNLFGGEDLFGFCAGAEGGEIWRAGSFGGVGDSRARIDPGVEAAEAGRVRFWLGIATEAGAVFWIGIAAA